MRKVISYKLLETEMGTKLPAHEFALDILKVRSGTLSEVTLKDGRTINLVRMGWGYDLGEDVAHITVDVQVIDPESESSIGFFYASDIERIVDPLSGAVWFDIRNYRGTQK